MVRRRTRFLGQMAGPAGVLLVLDDLQWADADALDLLATLVHAAGEIPLRVLGAYRDTEEAEALHLATLLADLAARGLAARRRLGPLARAEATALLEELLAGADTEAAARRERVLERAGGVPFFVVSWAQALHMEAPELDRADEETVPWSITQSIRQRVLALPACAPELLGVAAVIGRVVPRRLLAAVVAQPEHEVLAALDALNTAQLMHELGAETYAFGHDVIREVAESDLGAARRAALHRQVAEALEREPGLLSSALVAYHYSEGQCWPQALKYLIQAGDRAAATYANEDALNFYSQALAVCERLGDSALPTALEVARKRGALHYFILLQLRDAISDYERMATTARRLGDRHQEDLALAYRGAAEMGIHEFDTCEATLQAVLATTGDDDVRLHASLDLMSCLTLVGRLSEAEALLREIGDLVRRHGDHALQREYDERASLRFVWAGRCDDALAILARWKTTPLTAPAANEPMPSMSLYAAFAYGGKGDYATALRVLHTLLLTTERMGEVWTWRRALNTLGWLYGELQDHQRALEWNMRGLQAAQERGTPETNPETENNARLNLGDTLLALGRLDDAEEQFRTVEQMVRTPRPQDRHMLWRYAQHLFHSLGELWLARGEAEHALAYAGECLALAEQTASRKNIVKGRRLRGQSLLALGRLAEAEQELDILLHVAQEVGNPAQLWKTLVARGDLRRGQGRPLDARAEYRAALAVIDGVAAALTEVALRETFLTSAHVQYIRQWAQADLTQV